MAGRFTQVEIGTNTYHVRKFEPFLALEVLGELQKHLMGPLTRIIEAAQGDAINGGASSVSMTVGADTLKGMMDGIDKLSAGLDGKTLVALAKLVLNPEYVAVQIEGGEAEKLTQAAVNRAFEDIGEMGQLIVEVVKINYEGFMRRSIALIGQGLAKKAAKPSANSLLN